MPVTLQPIGHIKMLFDNRAVVQVAAGISIREALLIMKVNPEIVAGVVVNGELRTKDTILQDGDEVKLFAVAGGG